MTYRCQFMVRIAIVGLLSVAASPVARAQQPALTDADIARVKSEVSATVDKYYAYFSARNMTTILAWPAPSTRLMSSS